MTRIKFIISRYIYNLIRKKKAYKNQKALINIQVSRAPASMKISVAALFCMQGKTVGDATAEISLLIPVEIESFLSGRMQIATLNHQNRCTIIILKGATEVNW